MNRIKSTKRNLFPASEERMASDDGSGNEHQQEDRSSNLRVKYADAILDWIIFPLLIFIQFGTTMYFQQKFGALRLRWMPTMGLIAVFCVASIQYRKIFRVHPIESMALLLLPEICTNVILATVMFSDLMTALTTLYVSTAILLFTGAIGHYQLTKYKRSVTVPKSYGYKLLHSEENEQTGDEWIC